ncbi:MAG: tetratricopeptide repeat protein [Burkholderiaceae bacterium]|nr:tetratricopeptide repeat protein [Burkholderiaceae bacterium]
MMRPHRLAPVALALLAGVLYGASAQAQAPAAQSAASVAASPEPLISAMDGELFYQLLLGEIKAIDEEPGPAFQLILDAARKTNDPRLYQRAVAIAFQARSGESALQAARAWKQAQPLSREANRSVLQILIALNRIGDTAEPLKSELALIDPRDRSLALSTIPLNYSRATDKKLAASVVEQAVADYLVQPATAAGAWTAVGRMRLAAGDLTGAFDAARRGQAVNVRAEGPALLALELMSPTQPQAEILVRRHLEARGQPEVRMGYARALLDAQRYAEASQQLKLVTAEKPDLAEAWLVLGTLQLQDNQLAPAEVSLRRYVALAQGQRQGEERSRGLAQAYLSLAQLSEKRRDFVAAEAWLARIDNSQDLMSAQTRRASIMAQQGRLADARQLLRKIPERNPGDARLKLLAEVQLLRDNKQNQAAYDLLAQALVRTPRDTDLMYDQAMLAEKLGNLTEMESLLRQVIALKPDAQHAYNALGYSLADRNVRLPEARQLIQKALELTPNDPFISDSLGWVEFRLGNRAEALRILEAAYKARPDAEIAAHLGEVLFSIGQRERALAIWKEGLLLNAENETLQETLKRLRVKL